MTATHVGSVPAVVERRLKYLQRLPFPGTDVNVGKGGRIYYDAVDVVKIVIALEFLAAGVGPAETAKLVNGGWARISSGFANAWASRFDKVSTILLMARVEGMFADRSEGLVTIVSAEDLVLWGRQYGGGDRRVVLVNLIRCAEALYDAFDVGSEGSRVVLEHAVMRQHIDAWALDHQRRIAKTGS